MKKIITLALAALMLIAMLGAFASCKKNENGDEKQVDYVKVKLTNEQYAYGVDKNNPELLATVNEVLEEIKENGKLDEIVNKYFSNDEANFQYYPAGTEDSTKNQLVVATNTPFSPFEEKDGDRYCGIDIEIAAMIAEKLGAELVIKDMNFSSILTAVETGKADIAMAGLTVSAEREQQVTFSNTYYEASQVIIYKAGDETFANCTTAAEVEAILNGMNSDTIIGYQNGTTGGLYVEGDIDWEFPGFPVTAKGYSSASTAVQALINGQIDYVVVDEGPAQIIVNSINN